MQEIFVLSLKVMFNTMAIFIGIISAVIVFSIFMDYAFKIQRWINKKK